MDAQAKLKQKFLDMESQYTTHEAHEFTYPPSLEQAQRHQKAQRVGDFKNKDLSNVPLKDKCFCCR